jgi:SNF2 family DNA or RNA helicase
VCNGARVTSASVTPDNSLSCSGFLPAIRCAVVQGSGKLQALQALLDVLDSMGKCAVIAAHASLSVLSDYLALRYGESHFCRVDEDTPVLERTRAISRLNDAKSPEKLLILEVSSCSLGTDLPTADAVIIYDSDGHPSGDIQHFGFARRLGDPAKLLVLRLYCSGTLEEVIVAVCRPLAPAIAHKSLSSCSICKNTTGFLYKGFHLGRAVGRAVLHCNISHC